MCMDASRTAVFLMMGFQNVKLSDRNCFLIYKKFKSLGISADKYITLINFSVVDMHKVA